MSETRTITRERTPLELARDALAARAREVERTGSFRSGKVKQPAAREAAVWREAAALVDLLGRGETVGGQQA